MSGKRVRSVRATLVLIAIGAGMALVNREGAPASAVDEHAPYRTVAQASGPKPVDVTATAAPAETSAAEAVLPVAAAPPQPVASPAGAPTSHAAMMPAVPPLPVPAPEDAVRPTTIVVPPIRRVLPVTPPLPFEMESRKRADPNGKGKAPVAAARAKK